MLQRLCRKRIGWDERLNEEDVADWERWLKGMQSLGSLRIPRCVRPIGSSDENQELHVFSDASEVGYGVVAYCRWSVGSEHYTCRLLFAKSRVAPLKTVTVPRLELNAARLAARVAAELKRQMSMCFTKTVFWTDSTIVLYYIRNTTSRFCTFVANRISTIRQLSSPGDWRHISSSDNPADLASRGTSSIDSLNTWLRGPSFLECSETLWPSNATNDEPEGVELKTKHVFVNVTTAVYPSPNFHQLIERYSDWFKLLKSIVWLTRFKNYLMILVGSAVEKTLNTGCLKLAEIRRAEVDIIRVAQEEVFSGLIRKLKGTERADERKLRNLGLLRLHPIILNGLLCVGGRLCNLNWPHVSKNPIILPPRHHITKLIIYNCHVTNGHSGISHTLGDLRRKYWIMQGTSMVKRVIHDCWTCRKNLVTASGQFMAPLPIDRVQPGWNPFRIVGCDYFGPVSVKNGRKFEKRYGCIFTCLQMRAVHLEMAYSLSTDSFINVLMRFIARRGAPEKLITDNGSNFVGAEIELKRAIQRLPHSRISTELLRREVEWQFNPPLSSHRGGVWERLIRSVRRILRSTVNEQVIDDDKFCTFLTEAERILNTRPIVPNMTSEFDKPALTPNDLLLLTNRVYGVVPSNISERYVKGWQQVNYLAQVFWKRWIREYLPLLQERTKWQRKHRNFKERDVVLVHSSTSNRDRWPVGVVEECEMSGDGLVRTVLVRTRDGRLRRDVRKISLLEGAE